MPRGQAIHSRSISAWGGSPGLASLPDRLLSASVRFKAVGAVCSFGVQRFLRGVVWFAKRPFQSSLRSSAIRHLEDAQMLAYQDGELSTRARQRAAAHLRGCWSCRGRLRELCVSVEAYIVCREERLPDPSSEAARRVRELRERLAHVIETPPVNGTQ